MTNRTGVELLISQAIKAECQKVGVKGEQATIIAEESLARIKKLLNVKPSGIDLPRVPLSSPEVRMRQALCHPSVGFQHVSGTLFIRQRDRTGINPDVVSNIGGGLWELILRQPPEIIAALFEAVVDKTEGIENGPWLWYVEWQHPNRVAAGFAIGATKEEAEAYFRAAFLIPLGGSIVQIEKLDLISGEPRKALTPVRQRPRYRVLLVPEG